MDNQVRAELYALCFEDNTHNWQAEDFRLMLENPHNTAIEIEKRALCLVQLIGDEAEILTFMVHPIQQGQGNGARLWQKLMDFLLENNAKTLLLEVAEDNEKAIGLYRKFGCSVMASRKNYYHRKDGARVNALIMRKELTR